MTRIRFVVKYDTPLVQKTQEFSTLFAARNFADDLVTSEISDVHFANVSEVQTHSVAYYSRKD